VRSASPIWENHLAFSRRPACPGPHLPVTTKNPPPKKSTQKGRISHGSLARAGRAEPGNRRGSCTPACQKQPTGRPRPSACASRRCVLPAATWCRFLAHQPYQVSAKRPGGPTAHRCAWSQQPDRCAGGKPRFSKSFFAVTAKLSAGVHCFAGPRRKATEAFAHSHSRRDPSNLLRSLRRHGAAPWFFCRGAWAKRSSCGAQLGAPSLGAGMRGPQCRLDCAAAGRRPGPGGAGSGRTSFPGTVRLQPRNVLLLRADVRPRSDRLREQHAIYAVGPSASAWRALRFRQSGRTSATRSGACAEVLAESAAIPEEWTRLREGSPEPENRPADIPLKS